MFFHRQFYSHCRDKKKQTRYVFSFRYQNRRLQLFQTFFHFFSRSNISFEKIDKSAGGLITRSNFSMMSKTILRFPITQNSFLYLSSVQRLKRSEKLINGNYSQETFTDDSYNVLLTAMQEYQTFFLSFHWSRSLREFNSNSQQSESILMKKNNVLRNKLLQEVHKKYPGERKNC